MFEQFETHRLSASRCPAFADTARDWLPKVLEDFSIPLHKFGTGCHKTLDDLADEILRGETRLEVDLQSGRLIRVGAVVRLDVLYLPADAPPLKLYEAGQCFNDGRTRHRPTEFAVWEKLKGGEDPDSCLLRALTEELKLTGPVTAIPGAISEVLRDPEDYPAIRSKFRAFDFEVHLSPDQFCPAGYKEIQPDKTTTFLWQPLGSCCAHEYILNPEGSSMRVRPLVRFSPTDGGTKNITDNS